jgi:hypothetical protein
MHSNQEAAISMLNARVRTLEKVVQECLQMIYRLLEVKEPQNQ